MRRLLLTLATIALLMLPAMSPAQSPTPEAKKTAKTDESTKPSGDGIGLIMRDSWITTKTKLALTTDGRTKARHIAVETKGAVVTLRGKVSTVEERKAAEEIARGISGVASVNNTLQIVPDAQRKVVDAQDDAIETALRERLLKDSQFKDATIKVRSDNGVVTLIGKVSDPKAKLHATNVAHRVPGVKGVRNELALKG